MKIGDKVIGKNFRKPELTVWNGIEGKIININRIKTITVVGVQFKKKSVAGHNCDSIGELGYCRFFSPIFNSDATFDNLTFCERQLELDFNGGKE